MNEWISINKPPKENGDYLTFRLVFGYPKKQVFSFAKKLNKIDEFDFKGEKGSGFYYYDGEYGYTKVRGVTHWMELPEDPV